jgi:hypothetical protein
MATGRHSNYAEANEWVWEGGATTPLRYRVVVTLACPKIIERPVRMSPKLHMRK